MDTVSVKCIFHGIRSLGQYFPTRYRVSIIIQQNSTFVKVKSVVFTAQKERTFRLESPFGLFGKIDVDAAFEFSPVSGTYGRFTD